MLEQSNKISEQAKKKARVFIIAVSLLIPLIVASLYLLPKPENIEGGLRNFIDYLPAFNATINGSTFVILILALMAIKNKNVNRHKKLMFAALILSVFFLLSYVTYHYTTEPTSYGGEGFLKNAYYIILITHILMSAVVVPMVLISFVRALSEQFDRHKKIAKFTMPIWLYVTLTGVIVYLMISPYY